jgi:hypothetical protein
MHTSAKDARPSLVVGLRPFATRAGFSLDQRELHPGRPAQSGPAPGQSGRDRKDDVIAEPTIRSG